MPFILPLSVKVAITAGLVIGGTIATLNNKDKILDATADVLERGAEFCRERKKKAAVENLKFADNYEDGAFADYGEKDQASYASGSSTDEDFTTPDSSDLDITDIDTDYDISRINTNERYDDTLEAPSLD